MVMEIPTRLFNAALMVAPQAVDEILAAKMAGLEPAPGRTGVRRSQEGAAPTCLRSNVTSKSADKLQAFACLGQEVAFTDEGYAIIDGVAVIEISGGLTYRAYNWWTTSYLDIRDSFRAAIADVRALSVVFLIDSPGGEVAGLFDLVDEIYKTRGTKPIIAIADEAAFSAAYAIASAADEIYLSSTAQVGSIGVIAIHIDQSGYDKNLGLRYTAIFAGNHKNDFNPHEPLKVDGKELLQAHVDKLYDMFTAIVARNRSMTQAAVVDTQAGFYMGAAAVEAGLADGILSVRDIMTKMGLSKGDMGMNLNEVKDCVNQALAESMSEVKKMLEEQHHALEVIEARFNPPDTVIAGLEPAGVEREGSERASLEPAPTTVGDIVDLCGVAGMPELAGAMIRDKLTLDDAKIAILDTKAKAAAQSSIISTVGPIASGESNPLLADAKKRAGIR
jgi:signal peptide peptidase SppA